MKGGVGRGGAGRQKIGSARRWGRVAKEQWQKAERWTNHARKVDEIRAQSAQKILFDKNRGGEPRMRKLSKEHWQMYLEWKPLTLKCSRMKGAKGTDKNSPLDVQKWGAEGV